MNIHSEYSNSIIAIPFDIFRLSTLSRNLILSFRVRQSLDQFRAFRENCFFFFLALVPNFFTNNGSFVFSFFSILFLCLSLGFRFRVFLLRLLFLLSLCFRLPKGE